jgi:hypothetical protein
VIQSKCRGGRKLIVSSDRDMDLASSRDFKVSERFGLEFRAEGSNAFNMVSLITSGELLVLIADVNMWQDNQRTTDTQASVRPQANVLILPFW